MGFFIFKNRKTSPYYDDNFISNNAENSILSFWNSIKYIGITLFISMIFGIIFIISGIVSIFAIPILPIVILVILLFIIALIIIIILFILYFILSITSGVMASIIYIDKFKNENYIKYILHILIAMGESYNYLFFIAKTAMLN